VLGIVLFTFLLNSNVGQMDHHVVKIGNVRSIVYVTKSCKPEAAQPYFEGSIASNQYVDSKIKLFTTHEERLVNIA